MNKLDSHNDKLQDKYKKLQTQIGKLQAQAKNYLQKSKQTKGSTSQMYKQKCLMTLKQKKQLQQQMKGVLSHQAMINNAKLTAQNMINHKQMVLLIQSQMTNMQDVLKQQKQVMKTVNVDKMDQLRQQMMEMKFESDYMNEMMNRNYDMDMDEDEFEDEFADFEREVAKEKKKTVVNPNKNINQPQINKGQMNIYDDDFDVNKL